MFWRDYNNDDDKTNEKVHLFQHLNKRAVEFENHRMIFYFYAMIFGKRTKCVRTQSPSKWNQMNQMKFTYVEHTINRRGCVSLKCAVASVFRFPKNVWQKKINSWAVSCDSCILLFLAYPNIMVKILRVTNFSLQKNNPLTKQKSMNWD